LLDLFHYYKLAYFTETKFVYVPPEEKEVHKNGTQIMGIWNTNYGD